MFDYNEQVQAYETDCVNLPQAVKDKLRDQREANRSRLKRNRPDSIRLNDDHFIPQGSMAIGTTVQEENNAYDIDDGVWFHKDDLKKKDGTAYTARETQEMVRDAVKDPNFNKQPEIHNNCVRRRLAERAVQLSEDFSTPATYRRKDRSVVVRGPLDLMAAVLEDRAARACRSSATRGWAR